MSTLTRANKLEKDWEIPQPFTTKKYDISTIADNSYSSDVYYEPFPKGSDLSSILDLEKINRRLPEELRIGSDPYPRSIPRMYWEFYESYLRRMRFLHKNSYDRITDDVIQKFGQLRKGHKKISFKIGDDEYMLSHELHHLVKALVDSQNLLTLPNDWDDEGASATDFPTLKKAVDFIVKYSEYILKTPRDIVIDTPDIDILRDGSISVNWETDKGSFLIIFKRGEHEFTYLYGKDRETKRTFPYAIKNDQSIDQITALWMSQYLKKSLEISYH